MKKRELFQGDLLTDLMRHSSLETPSDDFTLNVMSRVGAMPAYQSRKKPFFIFIKSALPWMLLVAIFVLFYVSSDLPYGKYLPGGEYMKGVLLPAVNSFFSSFKELASNKFYSIALVILICGGGLFGIERLFSRKVTANRHYLI